MEVILVGYGKMGKSIEGVLKERQHRVLSHTVRRDLGQEIPLESCLSRLAEGELPDLAFEFSTPSAAETNVRHLLSRGIPTVCGTTGWEFREAAELAESTGTPFLFSANFSLGMAVMRHTVRLAARMFAPFEEFQAAIFERHHSAKVDRPSGTAKMLAKTMAEISGSETEIVSVRQGGVPGEHLVYFDGVAECVEITHRARSREIFSRGAVLAGEWLASERPRGFVTLDDFLERTCPWSLV